MEYFIEIELTDLQENNMYTFSAIAINVAGNSPFSNIATASKGPAGEC